MIRVGVIGSSFARLAYLPALRVLGGVEVVALSSAHAERARAVAEEFGVRHAYGDWEEMLAHHELDLVCIATPTLTHAPMTLAALRAGAHVLCEKPMAMDAREAKAMRDVAMSSGRLNMIDHELRFNPNRRHAADLIHSGAIGEIRHVDIFNVGRSWSDRAGRPMGDWWSLAEKGGGRLGANGSHQIDLARWWFGDVTSVVGTIDTVVAERVDPDSGEPWIATADDLVHFTLSQERASLVDVLLSGVANHNAGNQTRVFGAEGTIILSNETETLMVGRRGGEMRDESRPDPDADLPGIGKGIWNVSVVGLLRELLSAIKEDRPLTQGATFDDGYRTQLVMDAVRLSSVERRWVVPSALGRSIDT